MATAGAIQRLCVWLRSLIPWLSLNLSLSVTPVRVEKCLVLLPFLTQAKTYSDPPAPAPSAKRGSTSDSIPGRKSSLLSAFDTARLSLKYSQAECSWQRESPPFLSVDHLELGGKVGEPLKPVLPYYEVLLKEDRPVGSDDEPLRGYHHIHL